MNEHIVAFIVRTKGFEDERIIKKEAELQYDTSEVAIHCYKPSDNERKNILFNNAVLIAMHKDRKFKDTFIFMDGVTLVACIKTNHVGKAQLYYYSAKPNYLHLLQKRIK